MKSIRVVFIVRFLFCIVFSSSRAHENERTTDLSEPIDVYNEWINELNEERDSGSEDSDSD